MRTRRSNYPNNSNVTIPRRRRKQVSNIVELEIRTIVASMAERTMEELLRAPTEGYGEAIVLPEINADHFEIKTNLLQLVQANLFYGRESENPHAHINSFKRITSDFFPISAWERFKELVRACPHHGFTELTQVDTFYNGLNENEQDSLNAAAGGNLLSKTTREALNIIENKSKVRYSRNRSKVLGMNATSSKTDERINKIANQLSTFVEIVSKKVVTPALVKAVGLRNSCCLPVVGWPILGSTAQIPSLAIPISIPEPDVLKSLPKTIPESDIPKSLPKPNIPYPSRRDDQKSRDKALNQMEKIFKIFQDLRFDISFADALLLIPIFAPTIKSLLMNKEKFLKLAKIPLNENCSVMLLKKLPEKLRDPDKFLIPCNFQGMDVCHALADLGASINLMPLSIWKRLSLPKLTPTRMTLELADRSITYPKGLAEDVFVKVGKFHFSTDFVVVDFEADPRVPLILGRSFLRTGRALIDVYGEEITLRVDNEAATFNLDQTTRYSSTNDKSDDSISLEIDHANCNPEEDICLIEELLNNDPFQLPLMDLKQSEVTETKSSIEEPPELELKDLSSHLEYAFLEENDKLPVIIAKGLKNDEKDSLLKVLKSHKGAIAWKITDIKGIDPRFCTYKILMEDDYKPTVQVKRRVTKNSETMEVFMDDFSVFGCEDTNLVLNWEKCHFMCREGIMLGHKISKSRIEVDRAKVDVIAKLPHPTTVKGVRSFLGHAGFYRRFIQDFSKIARPMTHLLEKETPFVFSKDCIDAFLTLKKKLTEAPILVVLDWNLPFELMCDASDFAIGAVLGQQKMKHFQPIHYASKTMTEA
ncbi:reverse transcriptase domain-containing protein [Tanacetum coccineum]|uniref:Reverse transcriptase domain-containing protein n=1 Tax=Tanacetum coccineum TaxID=301880 RepID=A0ABQ5BXT2_9ASTR